MFPKFLLILLSIVYIIILPVNFLAGDIPYGIYNLIAILVVTFLWLLPLYYLNIRNKTTYFRITFLILLNMIIASYILYNGEKYGEQLERQNVQKAQQYTNQGLIKVK